MPDRHEAYHPFLQKKRAALTVQPHNHRQNTITGMQVNLVPRGASQMRNTAPPADNGCGCIRRPPVYAGYAATSIITLPQKMRKQRYFSACILHDRRRMQAAAEIRRRNNCPPRLPHGAPQHPRGPAAKRHTLSYQPQVPWPRRNPWPPAPRREFPTPAHAGPAASV